MHTVILVLAGLFLLIGGIMLMRHGLKRLLGRRLNALFAKLTVTPWRGLLVGTVAAALLQSSTAVSLLTIGLVSAGCLSFYQSLGIILGANIGTCTTVQIMALSLPDAYLAPLFLLSAIVMLAIRRLRYGAMALCGVLSLFIGLNAIADAVSGLSHLDAAVEYLLLAKTVPFYGLLSGMLITLLFQSGSASTGLLMTLAAEGAIDPVTAAYVIYGNNIGSCLSSVFIGAAAPPAARRVAVAHIVLNLAGVACFWPFTAPLASLAAACSADLAVQIALIHTLFNVVSSLAVVPFARTYARLIERLVPGGRRTTPR